MHSRYRSIPVYVFRIVVKSWRRWAGAFIVLFFVFFNPPNSCPIQGNEHLALFWLCHITISRQLLLSSEELKEKANTGMRLATCAGTTAVK